DTITKLSLLLLLCDEYFGDSDTIGKTRLDQLLWGLAVVKTVSQGLTIGETQPCWQVDEAFHTIYHDLEEEGQHQGTEYLAFQLQQQVIGLLVQYDQVREDASTLLRAF